MKLLVTKNEFEDTKKKLDLLADYVCEAHGFDFNMYEFVEEIIASIEQVDDQ